jgi:CHAT domain-containing protein/Tfp pilus assembly protein PilF
MSRITTVKSSLTGIHRFCIFSYFLCLTGPGQIILTEPRTGVIVEAVTKLSMAEKAGLQPGDMLTHWTVDRSRGAIDTPFDLDEVEIELAPRGPVVLHGRRGKNIRKWTIGSGPWGLKTRPTLQNPLMAIYTHGRDLLTAGQTLDAAQRWQTAKTSVRAGKRDTAVVTWFALISAQALEAKRLWAEADTAFENAVKLADAVGPTEAARTLRLWGDSFATRNDWKRAEDCYQMALAKTPSKTGESFRVADNLNNLGTVAVRSGRIEQGKMYYEQALAICKPLAPQGQCVAKVLRNLGTAAAMQSDLRTATQRWTESLLISRAFDPASVDVAATLNNLSRAAVEFGDLAGAERNLKAALQVFRQADPSGRDVGNALNNLGIVATARGDLTAAETYHLQALKVREYIGHDTVDVAASLNNLGSVAVARRDLDGAYHYFDLALQLRKRLTTPNSIEVAESLSNLGDVVLYRGEFAKAKQLFVDAWNLFREHAPGSTGEAELLNNLGIVSLKEGDLAAAADYHKNALNICETVAPGSLCHASSLMFVGIVAEQKHEFNRAEEYYKRSLEIRRQIAPGTTAEAESWYYLGRLYRQKGDNANAIAHFGSALNVLEGQFYRVGGPEEVRSGFGAWFRNYYTDYMQALLESERKDLAFNVLERSRARSFLIVLAERDLSFESDLSPELIKRRQLNAQAYDRVQAQIAKLNATTDLDLIRELQMRLRELQAERGRIAESVRQSAPNLWSLQYRQPLELSAVRANLDPGTLLLSYSVGTKETTLYAVRPSGSEPGLSVFKLKIGEEELREEVKRFRNLIQRHDKDDIATINRQAEELYRQLMYQADALLSSSARVVIIPDGPLHVLPFSALRHDNHEFVAQWKPIHVVVSATVYAQLRETRSTQKRAQFDIVAFGHPVYSSKDVPTATGNALIRSAIEKGFVLGPLEASRKEVDRITALFPGRSRALVDGEATERKAKDVGTSARMIHFAAHGMLDDQFPLNSAIILSIPKEETAGDNGLLQAWEILDQVRLNADLVTLSACQTGLGQEVGGEGLIGLVRAFLFAGARSVLASLWSIDDPSTADLMETFYSNLKSGKAKDEALRTAQIEFINSSKFPQRFSHPYYWAAFSLIGDWQ